MRVSGVALVLLGSAAGGLAAQDGPRTTAERTDFAVTSSNADVAVFLDSLQRAGAPLTVSVMGTSVLGNPIYLAIASDPPLTSPAEAARAGKLVVYLQANIHGGEVEGKEAALALLRELAGPAHDLLRSLVILVAPDYNPDGNDALGPQATNRAEQNGPERIGRRPNGLNLDLNRDYFKVEAPETRASLEHVYTTWDPALMVDLHTTDGTRHGYLLTYSPPLDPNGPAEPTAYVRDVLLPAVRRTLQERYHEPVFDYGNVDDPLDPKRWDTYAPLGWYGTNYVGLRGRMAILSEAYSHADFRTRVRVTHDFVMEILRFAAQHGDTIGEIEREADRRTTREGAAGTPAPELAVGFHLASRGVEPVVLEVMRSAADSGSGRRALHPTGMFKTYPLEVYDRFADSLARPLPAGYFLPAAAGDVAALLRLHGVRVARLTAPWTDTVQALPDPRLTWAPREFQGHHLLTVRGDYSLVVHTFPAGTYFVPTAQPLGRLVFSLLEPEGYGLARWGAFDRLLGSEVGVLSGLVYGSAPAREFPVWRVARAPLAPSRTLP